MSLTSTSQKSLSFGFADVTQNGDMRSSKNLRLRQTIEAAIRDPTATPPRPTLGPQPTGWEPLL